VRYVRPTRAIQYGEERPFGTPGNRRTTGCTKHHSTGAAVNARSACISWAAADQSGLKQHVITAMHSNKPRFLHEFQ